METSEPKSVNSISNAIGVNSLRFGDSQMINLIILTLEHTQSGCVVFDIKYVMLELYKSKKSVKIYTLCIKNY